jgi:hypothetical protein
MTVIVTMTWMIMTVIQATKVAAAKQKRPQISVAQVKGKDRMEIRKVAHLTKVVADVAIWFPKLLWTTQQNPSNHTRQVMRRQAWHLRDISTMKKSL